jgi:hypothetical protein
VRKLNFEFLSVSDSAFAILSFFFCSTCSRAGKSSLKMRTKKRFRWFEKQPVHTASTALGTPSCHLSKGNSMSFHFSNRNFTNSKNCFQENQNFNNQVKITDFQFQFCSECSHQSTLTFPNRKAMRLQPRAQFLFLSAQIKKKHRSGTHTVRCIELCAPLPSKAASSLRVLLRWQPRIPASQRELAVVACSGKCWSAPVLQQRSTS